ncbi:MAG: AMP-binding protein [Alcaligenaceae bacterium]
MLRTHFDTRALTIGNVLREKAQRHPERRALTYLPDGRRYTYGELHRLSNQLANGLSSLGIKQGDHVAVMLDNCPEQLLLYFALGKIGAVAVPLNPAIQGKMLTYFLTHSDCMGVICDARLLTRLAEISLDTPLIRVRVAFDEDREHAAVLAEPRMSTVVDYRVLTQAQDGEPECNVSFRDLAFLLYTSGTTGPSKANMFTQAQTLLYAIDQVDSYGYKDSDTVYVCLPLFHANGLLSSTYGPLMVDGHVAMTRRFSASAFWDDIRSAGATVTGLLGSMTNILWHQPVRPNDADNPLRSAVLIPVTQFGKQFTERFGIRAISSYGLTDYALATIYREDDLSSKLGSAGRPRFGMQVRVVDDDDFDMPANKLGEILLRSDNMWGTSLGYYKMPEATLTAMQNAWFHTGDRGYLDDDGYLYFVDRKKDVIRRRGENISAFEVEEVIISHSQVSDVAVFPVKSNMSEDEVAVCVILAPGAQLSETALTDFCIANMAYFMVPRYVRFVLELPRTPSQKIEKYKLQAEAQSNMSAFWDREQAGIILRRT